LPEGFNLKLNGSCVIRRIGRNTIGFYIRYGQVVKIIRLNPTAEFVFRLLEKGCSRQEIVLQLVKAYNIDTARAEEDIDVFIEALKKHNMLAN